MTTLSNAEIYDRRFVPALFGQWGPIVAAAAQVDAGHKVLDVACGTGALACAVNERVGPEGSVTGLDPNDEMLTVARSKQPDIEWQEGAAEELPFDDATFDAVVSQFGFMFFDNKEVALREMMRVLKPGGRLALAVCDGLDHSPGYAVLTELLHRLFGHDIANAFRAPFSCGDRDQLRDWFNKADIPDATLRRQDGRVHFDSVDDLVATERACAWTLGGLLNDAQFDRLKLAAGESLAPFIDANGQVTFTMPSLLVTARKQ
ncbi:methyltransferase domain-containing protein [Saccharospirillum salsuginis]|uniref:Ubiquinone/menaquinone biosynthesis methyltransferase n=1 Tax=Saccharospirillum salsuginis TaxID=418750 RepID=A0A918N603_9GAMM|nr:methyltransferase domain-containing protein [Saccharospirillum salsuginis]GGX40836.1 ubiquinone/menaquinone biosynthesis methyltransferase [Saccharospirillum salsuginis]